MAIFGKSILQVPDTGTRVLDNTRPFLRSSIVSFWITPARSKERKYHIFRQYWYTRNVPVFTNTGTFQYLGPEVYFFPIFFLNALVFEPTDKQNIANKIHITCISLFWQIRNSGPSTAGRTKLEISWPMKTGEDYLLYLIDVDVDESGTATCTVNGRLNPENLTVRFNPPLLKGVGWLRIFFFWPAENA